MLKKVHLGGNRFLGLRINRSLALSLLIQNGIVVVSGIVLNGVDLN